MAEGDQYQYDAGYEGGSIRDLEERHRNLKDRLILVGQNLIDFREEFGEDMLDLKKDVEILKNSVNKIKMFMESLSGELGKFAKKEDLEILAKQAKMFQPTRFITRRELDEVMKRL
jgi:archaellum component FlaC